MGISPNLEENRGQNASKEQSTKQGEIQERVVLWWPRADSAVTKEELVN